MKKWPSWKEYWSTGARIPSRYWIHVSFGKEAVQWMIGCKKTICFQLQMYISCWEALRALPRENRVQNTPAGCTGRSAHRCTDECSGASSYKLRVSHRFLGTGDPAEEESMSIPGCASCAGCRFGSLLHRRLILIRCEPSRTACCASPSKSRSLYSTESTLYRSNFDP